MSSMRRSLWFGIAGIALATGPAQGFVEAPAISQYEILLPEGEFDPYQRQTPTSRSLSRATESTLTSAHGGSWRVNVWNHMTDTPHYVLGSGFETGVRLDQDGTAEMVARDQIAAHPDVFPGAVQSDLLLDGVRRGLGKVAVHFQQTHGGVPIIGGRAHLTFTEGGRLFVMKSGLFRGINLSTSPTVGREAAAQIAIGDLPVEPGTEALDGEVVLRILPVPRAADAQHRLVWVARVNTQDPVGIWVSHVDAHTGEIIYRYNDVHFLQYSGDATGDVQPDTYCNGIESQPMKYMNLTVSGVGSTTTDGNGDWDLGEGGTGDRNVTATLQGPYVNINNQSGADASFAGVMSGGVPFNIDWNDGNARRDERDVFDAIQDVHDLFELFDPGYGYSNQSITANVAIGQNCNAFWNGTINFYVEGSGCANTGEIQGVAHHEFGHGVQNDLIGGQGSQGLGEGNSDVLANLITQESHIGRGFNIGNCASGIRNSDNNLQYPDDLGGGVHSDGRIIAGFHWDIMTQLNVQMGQTLGTITAASIWHFGRKLEQPTIQPDQVLATRIADDDNGDLSDGTPNCVTIDNAAENHGFDVLCGLVLDHDVIDSRTAAGNVTASATITSLVSSIDDASLFYVVDNAASPRGGFSEVPLVDDNADNVYEATIPGLVALDQVSYYLRAEAADGSVQLEPNGAPANLFHFDIATLFHDQEVDQGWLVNVEGTDDATTGAWERVDPRGTAAQPEDDHTSAGVNCWVTQQCAPGCGLGDTDVDNGTTTLYSPNVNLTGSTTAIAKYWYWYSNNTGALPNQDSWVVDVRNNGGAWSTVQSTTVSTNAWVQFEVDLVALFGSPENIEFRFSASDLGGGSLVEAAVDDFAILADDAKIIAVGDGNGPRVSYLSDPRPNPFNPQTSLSFGLADDGAVQISIYDVSGRLVRHLVDDTQAAGHYQVTWDGTDDAGSSIASGVYYARLVTNGIVQQRKLTLLK